MPKPSLGCALVACHIVSFRLYLTIVDMHADTREAMVTVVSNLHNEYGGRVTAEHLVVVGDQKITLVSKRSRMLIVMI